MSQKHECEHDWRLEGDIYCKNHCEEESDFGEWLRYRAATEELTADKAQTIAWAIESRPDCFEAEDIAALRAYADKLEEPNEP